MHVRRFATHVEVTTPAKVNLFLEVLGKRSDGYHEIETLIAPVTLYDTLEFRPTDDGEITLHCEWAAGAVASEPKADCGEAARELLYGEIPRGRENLVWRAAELVRTTGNIRGGAAIRLIKRIPAAAGLGGASSDAAAALVAACAAWRLDWPRERFMELAANLGSDVPLFLAGGSAICRGRGERIERSAAWAFPLVIVRPPVGLSTPRVYGQCQPASEPQSIEPLMNALNSGNAAAGEAKLMNRLQPAAEKLTPWIARLQHELSQQDCLGHQMSGSGSSYFGICRSPRHARRVAARLRARSLGAVFAATTIAG
jgi:4-diphosphocytidyl-2-C-methyl-D-erythritol kinase